ncbi:hypothetical protein KSP40_PGU019923 [Platanthera guangdongensis]|uniref:Secreted protein n=1 Tax=Platanthera guangdongensis TaxID=2320717 RepID=A0ABR2LH31_9ASPA
MCFCCLAALRWFFCRLDALCQRFRKAAPLRRCFHLLKVFSRCTPYIFSEPSIRRILPHRRSLPQIFFRRGKLEHTLASKRRACKILVSCVRMCRPLPYSFSFILLWLIKLPS